MNIIQIREILESHGHACLELAKKITDRDGDPFNSEEKELIRLAVMPAVTEATDMIKSAYMVGNIKWVETEMERLHDLTKSTII